MSRIPVILGENQGHRVVLELVQPYQNKERNVTMDNLLKYGTPINIPKNLPAHSQSVGNGGNYKTTIYSLLWCQLLTAEPLGLYSYS